MQHGCLPRTWSRKEATGSLREKKVKRERNLKENVARRNCHQLWATHWDLKPFLLKYQGIIFLHPLRLEEAQAAGIRATT